MPKFTLTSQSPDATATEGWSGVLMNDVLKVVALFVLLIGGGVTIPTGVKCLVHNAVPGGLECKLVPEH